MQLLGSAPSSAKSSPPPNCSRGLGCRCRRLGCPSMNELSRNGNDVSRWNLLNPAEKPKLSHVEAVAWATRVARSSPPPTCPLYAEQIRPFVNRRYVTLGTDGFGRSDTREKLRHFFEVNRYWVTLAALKALADDGRSTATRSPRRSRSTGSTPTNRTR